jgi:GntR family transcriptional regulator
MPPFSISLRTGLPIYEQVIYAVTRAVVSGELKPGDPFPSVRALSQDLKINPNTAHKIVAALIERGLLVVRPGIGTVVSSEQPESSAAQRAILDEETERLVVEAKRAGLSLQDVITSVRTHWTKTVRRVG